MTKKNKEIRKYPKSKSPAMANKSHREPWKGTKAQRDKRVAQLCGMMSKCTDYCVLNYTTQEIEKYKNGKVFKGPVRDVAVSAKDAAYSVADALKGMKDYVVLGICLFVVRKDSGVPIKDGDGIKKAKAQK